MNIYWVTDGREDKILFPETKSGDVCKKIELHELPLSDEKIDLLIIQANAGKKQRSLRLGIRWLQRARREGGLLTPAIIFSFEATEKLVIDYPILNTKGVSLFRLPFSAVEIKDLIKNAIPPSLTKKELVEIVREHCGLLTEWEKAAHDFQTTLNNYSDNYEKARQIFNIWEPTVRRFAQAQHENLDRLKKLLLVDPVKVNLDELTNVFKKLKIGLKLVPGTNSGRQVIEAELESNPPKYYSKILVANDEPNLPIVSFLKTYYGYEVLRQATNLTSAKALFLSEEPQVVLADYYFKTPEEGMEFIRFVTDKKHKWSPLILVNSYHNLSNVKFPDGVIDCSGDEAQNPTFIHALIWKAANEDAFDEKGMEPEQRFDLSEGMLQVEDDYRRKVSISLIPGLQFNILRWGKFPIDALQTALKQARGLLSKRPTTNERFLIKELIEVAEPYENDERFSFQSVNNLIGMVSILHENISELPDSKISRDLHSICHTFKSYSLRGIGDVVANLDDLNSRLQILPRYRKSVNRITAICEQFLNGPFFLSDAVNLLKSIEKVLDLLPKIPEWKNLSEVKLKNQILILVVDDDDDWREEFVLSVVKETKAELEQLGFNVTWKAFDNAEDARRAVPKQDKMRGIKNNSRPVNTIAVVDLYLPKNNREARQIKTNINDQIFNIPQKQNGIDLIKDLRDPSRDISVIVLSTSGSDQDRRSIQRLGVSKKDHIIKGSNKRKELSAAIVRNATKSEKHIVEQFEEQGKPLIRVDGITLKLDNAEAEILEVILRLKRKTYITTKNILELLSNKIAENSIKKSVSSIRKKIQQSFALQGRQIGKEDIISTVSNYEGRKGAYKVSAEVIANSINNEYLFDEDGNSLPSRDCKVLVIENDIEISSYISDSLETIKGINIKQASNVEEAIYIAQTFRPDIISLDLAIPRTQKEFDAAPKSGDVNAGLDALEQIKLFLSNVNVILTSTYFKNKDLRDRAGQLGLSNENVIPKFERDDWINLLLQKVKQLKDEVLIGKRADLLPDVPEPVIEILDGCDYKSGTLKIKVNGHLYNPKKSQQAKILGLLLRNANKKVSYEKIGKHLGLNKVTLDNRKTWARRIRADIRDKWLKLPKTQTRAEEKILENSLSEGLILHTHISNPHKLR